jgi:hypothetical protein
MPTKPRTPLYEHNPIHAGTRFFTVDIKQKVVTKGYEHEGQQRFVKYAAETVVGIVESTEPWSTPKDKQDRNPVGEFKTVEEAEARADELEAAYADRGWHYNSFFVTLE